MADTIYRIVRRLTEKDLIKWLETKDPNETYNYLNGLNCAIAQFLRAMGCKFNIWSGCSIIDTKERIWVVPDWIAHADVIAADAEQRNFGNFLKDLKAYYIEKEIPID